MSTLYKLFTSKTKTILLTAVVIAVLVAVGSAIASGVASGKNVVQSLLTPIHSTFAAITRTAERFYNYVFEYESLQAENAYLEERIAAMEDEVRTADALQRENERYRQLLGFTQEHEDFSMVSAYIISWDSSNWKNTFTIGKGSNSGIEEDMCVITEQGQVVGLVTEVGANWSTVTTILDSSLRVSANLSSSGYNGIVQGAYQKDGSDRLRMDYLSTDAVIRNNDQVVTTGSTLYPRGLILGYVVDACLDGTGVAKYAIIDPAVELDALEQIFIITEYVNE